MKPISKNRRTRLLLLSVLLLTMTLAGDFVRPFLEKGSPDSNHHHDHGTLPTAEDDLDKAFNQAPAPEAVPPDPERERRMAIYHYNEGNNFLHRGNWQEAVANYKMALHHDKTLGEVYVNMSSAYLKGKQYAEAKQALDTLKTLAPGHPNLYYNLACYFSLTHREKESLQALQKSFKLGYKNRNDVFTDPDLENVRGTRDFKQWIQRR